MVQVASLTVPLTNLPDTFRAAKGQKMCDALWAINNAVLDHALHHSRPNSPHQKPSGPHLRRRVAGEAAEADTDGSDRGGWPWEHKNKTEANHLCEVAHEHRKDCGWFGITHNQCIVSPLTAICACTLIDVDSHTFHP